MQRRVERLGAFGHRVVLALLVVLLTASIVPEPSWAHHSFAMFDTDTTLTLTGKVTSFQWTNPHVYIEMDVTEGETVRHWTIELGSPSILQRAGWKFSDIKPGLTITATLNPLRDGQPGGLLGRVTLPDGRQLGNGPGR